MSLSYPIRCVFASSKHTVHPRQLLPRRCLHASSIRRQDDKNDPPSDNALQPPPSHQQDDPLDSLEPTSKPLSIRLAPKFVSAKQPPRKRKMKPKDFPAYSEEEKELLKQKYTPEQLAAIEAGEAAVNPQDLADQAVIRTGAMSFNYYEDFSKLRPVVDRPPPAPEENYDPNLKFKDEGHFTKDLAKFFHDTPEDADIAEYMKFEDNVRLTIGKPEAELNARDCLAPEIPKVNDRLMRQSAREAKTTDEDDDNAAYYRKLSKRIDMPVKDMKKLRFKQLVQRRVSNQTRMGKVQSLYYLTVAGNGKGLLGIGEGKGTESEEAMRQSILNAIRNLTPIPRYEERTIFGDVKGKVGATELSLYTRPPG